MKKRQFNLPTGGRTTSVKEYIKAWRDPIERFNEIAGTFTIGFDSGYLLGFKDGYGSLSIPYGTVIKILNAFDEQTKKQKR